MQINLRLLLCFTTIVAVYGAMCPAGDLPITFDHCAHMETEKMKWSDAENFCSSRGGHLTSVHDQYDNTAIRILAEFAECRTYWTGGKCKFKNCSWTDSTPFDFTAWSKGQPRSSKSCILSTLVTGTWSTEKCNRKKCFVCEIPMQKSDCADWYEAGYRTDGIYNIVINEKPYEVYCDMHTAGGGWTVFQRRVDGKDSFWNHSWKEYKDGFGTEDMGPKSNFWLGNEVLHQLTAKDKNVTLRIEMRGDRTPLAPDPNAFWWNHYYNFEVGPESADYPLSNLYVDWMHVDGNASTGWYDITYSVGAKFSTVDKINDPEPKCVKKYQMGGWWLRYCALASLNGAYQIKDYTNGYGMFWMINGSTYLIHPRESAMMLRPTNSKLRR